MDIGVLLEVVIGMMFVWLMLALVCMGVQEWVAGWLKLRSKDMEKILRGMLADPDNSVSGLQKVGTWIKGRLKKSQVSSPTTSSPSIVDQIYNHQLIKAFSKPGGKPSYIAGDTFALTLFDVIMTAGTEASLLDVWGTQLATITDKDLSKGVQTALQSLVELVKTNSEMNQTELVAKLTTMANEIKEQFKKQYPQSVSVLDTLFTDVMIDKLVNKLVNDTTTDQLTRGIAKWAVTNPKLAEALNGLRAGIEASEDVLATGRANVEKWLDNTMGRASGWYKRRAQFIGIIIGISFAILLNIDSMAIANTLWREPTVRAVLLAKAEQMEDLPDEIDSATPGAAMEKFNAQFVGLQLPIGWERITLDSGRQSIAPVDVPKDESGQLQIGQWIWSKLLGWAISGVAAAQGAPYWFDILKKLVNVRSSGKDPTEEKEKKGKKDK